MITVNRKSIFKKHWFEKGVSFLTDILGHDCEFLDHVDLCYTQR